MIKFKYPFLTLLLPGLALGLLLTALSWWLPSIKGALFAGQKWPWLLLLPGALLMSLAAIRLTVRKPKPLYLLAVLLGTALVYLFPNLFAPGCNGLPRALAGTCPNACLITVCTDWDAPGENGCIPPPGALGCCVSYGTTCDPNCPTPEPDTPTPVPPTATPTATPTPVPIYPPSISGSVSCALPGSNGWCRNGAILNLSASDPQGYTTTLFGDIAGVAFSCPAGPNCSRTLSAGNGTIHFQAVSSTSGLSSAVGSATFAYDPVLPNLALDISGVKIINGWYVSDVTATATVSDAHSGVALTEYSLDGGSWVTGTSAVINTDGAHTVHFRVTDRAGNVTVAPAQSVKIDRTAPTLSVALAGEMGLNGWHVSSVTAKATVSDAHSGVALTEYSLDGGSWTAGMSVVIVADGAHNLQFRVTDRAGNVTVAPAQSVKIDRTAPALSVALAGEMGLNGWHVSSVTATATVSDVTSGVDRTEYRLDGGSWVTGTSAVINTDGAHTVQFRVTDRAGNQATSQRDFQIDRTPPLSKFTAPIEASTGALAQGDFLLEGQSSDAASGLASVQLSTDAGQTWRDLAPSAAGLWRYTWQTRPLENGLYPVLARAQDRAGNVNPAAQVVLLLANHPPKVSVQDSWWVWQAGKLVVQERFLPVTAISLRIACLDGQPDVKLNFTRASLPDFFQWDRKCAQGQLATSGDHIVTLTACDQVGNCASDEGTIKVPFIAPITPTATATLLATPSPTRKPPTPTATLQVIAPTQESQPEVAVEKPVPALWVWPLDVLLGLLLAFGLSSLLDPRPAALRRLRQSWQKIARVDAAHDSNIRHP